MPMQGAKVKKHTMDALLPKPNWKMENRREGKAKIRIETSAHGKGRVHHLVFRTLEMHHL